MQSEQASENKDISLEVEFHGEGSDTTLLEARYGIVVL